MFQLMLMDMKNSKFKYIVYALICPLLIGSVPILLQYLREISPILSARKSIGSLLDPGMITLVYFSSLFSGLTVSANGSELQWRQQLFTLMCLPISLRRVALFRYFPAFMLPFVTLLVVVGLGSLLHVKELGTLVQMALIGTLAGLLLMSLTYFLGRIFPDKPLLTLTVFLVAYASFVSQLPSTDGILNFLAANVWVGIALILGVLLIVRTEIWLFLRKR